MTESTPLPVLEDQGAACANCHFAAPITDQWSYCRLRSPRVDLASPVGRFPQVRNHWLCGGWAKFRGRTLPVEILDLNKPKPEEKKEMPKSLGTLFDVATLDAEEDVERLMLDLIEALERSTSVSKGAVKVYPQSVTVLRARVQLWRAIQWKFDVPKRHKTVTKPGPFEKGETIGGSPPQICIDAAFFIEDLMDKLILQYAGPIDEYDSTLSARVQVQTGRLRNYRANPPATSAVIVEEKVRGKPPKVCVDAINLFKDLWSVWEPGHEKFKLFQPRYHDVLDRLLAYRGPYDLVNGLADALVKYSAFEITGQLPADVNKLIARARRWAK